MWYLLYVLKWGWLDGSLALQTGRHHCEVYTKPLPYSTRRMQFAIIEALRITPNAWSWLKECGGNCSLLGVTYAIFISMRKILHTTKAVMTPQAVFLFCCPTIAVCTILATMNDEHGPDQAHTRRGIPGGRAMTKAVKSGTYTFIYTFMSSFDHLGTYRWAIASPNQLRHHLQSTCTTAIFHFKDWGDMVDWPCRHWSLILPDSVTLHSPSNVAKSCLHPGITSEVVLPPPNFFIYAWSRTNSKFRWRSSLANLHSVRINTWSVEFRISVLPRNRETSTYPRCQRTGNQICMIKPPDTSRASKSAEFQHIVSQIS